MLDQLSQLPSFSSDTLPEDDVDWLFQRLQPLKAPEDLVERVLARLHHIGAAPCSQTAGEEPADSQLFPGIQGVSGLVL